MAAMMKKANFQTSIPCPFCNSTFKKLGNHLSHCSERNGRDYLPYLSQKTRDKRAKNSKKNPCPCCGKQFSRLDTHLRNNVICMSFIRPSNQAASDVTSVYMYASGQPSINHGGQQLVSIAIASCQMVAMHHKSSTSVSEAQRQEVLLSPPPFMKKEAFNYPTSAEEWLLADQQLAECVVPAVFSAASAEGKVKPCVREYSHISPPNMVLSPKRTPPKERLEVVEKLSPSSE